MPYFVLLLICKNVIDVLDIHMCLHWVQALQRGYLEDYNGKSRISTADKHGYTTEKHSIVDYV